MTDPERWLSAPDAPEGMGALLRTAQEIGPTALERAALGGKLVAASSAVWLGAGMKTLAAGLVLAGGVWMVRGSADPETSSIAPVVRQSVESSAEQAASPGPLRPVPELEDGAHQDNAPPAMPTVRSPEVSTAKRLAASPTKPTEANLLSQARAALEKSPQHALALLEQHARLYPQGVLSEERDVLKLRALKAVGQDAAAEQQEEKFRAAHPDSIHHVP